MNKTVIAALGCLISGCATTHPHDTATHSHDHASRLHFSHPLIAESPSPDTKVRIDVEHLDIDSEDEEGTLTTLRLGAEYAFHPSFSVEVSVPYAFLDLEGESSENHFDDAEVALKFANFAFEEHGLLLGYGIEFGLPTGDQGAGIGNDNLFEFEPFFDFGLKRGASEFVGFVSFGIPTNQNGSQEAESELGANLSWRYQVSPTWATFLELDGETVLSGDERGESVVNLSPGVKFAVPSNPNMQVGFGLGFPLSDDEEFGLRALASFFYHL